MIITINTSLRVTSDRYQWIVEEGGGENWRAIRFLHSLPNVVPVLLRDGLCTPRQAEAVREVERPIAALLRGVGAPLVHEVYRASPPKFPTERSPALFCGQGWLVEWRSAGRGSYQFCLVGRADETFGCWSVLRRVLKECLLLRIRLGAEPATWREIAAELTAAAEKAAAEPS